jgi:heme exporter protein A
LLRAIAGFLRPSAGRVTIEPYEERELAVHYLGHHNALKLAASVRAHAHFWAGLLGGSDNPSAAIETVGLQRATDAPARVLSQGQQRRLALARLLVARRPIWLLDEPAAALDSAGREMLLAMLAAHRANGGLALAAVHEPLGAAPDFALTLGA